MSFLKIRICISLEKKAMQHFWAYASRVPSIHCLRPLKKRNRENSFYKIEKGKKEASTVFHQWNENIFLPSFHSWFIFLFVESAGSASVAFHLLSPGSRPYFSQAILQSAAATNPWAMVTKKEAKLRARRLAEILDCPYEDVRFHRYYSIHTKPYGDCVFCSLQDFVLCDKTFVRCILVAVWLAHHASTCCALILKAFENLQKIIMDLL